MTPQTTLLRAVERLHQQGLEQVRVRPYFYALGTWRLEITVAGDPRSATTDSFFHYSSAQEWNFFGDFDLPTTVGRLATRLERRLPNRAAALQPSPGYRFWYAALLQRCTDDGVPYLYREYEDYLSLGYVGIMKDGGAGEVLDRFPLPPA